MSDGQLRVLLVDDQRLIRAGFRLMLDPEDDIEVVAEAESGPDAVVEANTHRPDVTLMDIEMGGGDGISATRKITAAGTSRVIVVTTFDRDDYLFDALDAGASGFLLKTCEPAQLIDAIRAVAGGHALLSPEVTRRVIEARQGVADQANAGPSPEQVRRLAELTDREREVLVELASGYSNVEIASRLYVGESTVKTHISHVLAKLGVRDRVQAVVFAYEVGLVGGHGAVNPVSWPHAD